MGKGQGIYDYGEYGCHGLLFIMTMFTSAYIRPHQVSFQIFYILGPGERPYSLFFMI